MHGPASTTATWQRACNLIILAHGGTICTYKQCATAYHAPLPLCAFVLYACMQASSYMCCDSVVIAFPTQPVRYNEYEHSCISYDNLALFLITARKMLFMHAWL